MEKSGPGNEGEELTGEVIGIVGSVRWAGMASDPQATTYWWFPQVSSRQLTIVTRTIGDPIPMARTIANQIGELDPNQPVAEIRPLRDFVSTDLGRPRFTTLILGGFAAAAMLLAAIGLYGVIAFDVEQRVRELGVRMALGAQRVDVLRLIMRRGMLLTGTGLVIGTALALGLGSVMAGLLYGVTPRDPPTLAAVAGFLLFVAALATYLPARRAARVDPLVTLRSE